MKLGQTVLHLILSCAMGSLAGLAVPVTSHSQDVIEGIASKRLARLVAADNDVVEQSGREDSGTAGHDPSVSKNRDHLSRLY